MAAGPTVKTVARAAGVSPATVSNAYNRPERLSAQVRARIFAIAEEQGYSGPDPAARSLRTRRAGAIGAIFTVGLSRAFSDPYLVAMLGGLTEVAERTRTALVLIPIAPTTAAPDADEVRESVEAVQRAVVDGVLAYGLGDEHPAVRVLAGRRVPLVRSSDTDTGRCVIIDDTAGGRVVGEHLARLGHRDVAVVVASPEERGEAWTDVDESVLYPYSRLRLAGIRAGLGVDARVSVVSGGGGNSVESGRAAARLILDRSDRPSAVAAVTDVLAFGVLAAARSHRLRPGRDIAVTGFDDVPAARAAGLTTVRQPIREKGRLMGRMLLDPTFTERRVVLPTELVVRASTDADTAEGDDHDR
jgi:DNA-binding LacI/PurR family transcriptional regulator